ncbi:oligosaccharide flippase family protein [Rhodoblastus sp.]|uniref:oligosaccharide flippase family protein n=1 Tax=Rhodoblastus sp. TaxID=1962975 RepID=UPI003F95155C
MQGLNYLRRGQALFLISALEYVLPFFRMLLLSRFLDLRELGFCSALLASYGLLEQVTDMALYRFVMSTKREEYGEALACAHSLSVLRGIVVGALAVLAAPVFARSFSLTDYWTDFALLGALSFIKSFENFAPRVAEREFHFGAQLKTGLVANVLSFGTLVVMLLATHDHRALLGSLIVFMFCYVAASHFFSETPYRISFHSALFPRAFKFALPLMINGMGLALSGQADRFLVGSLLGLPILGIYSLISTAVILPTNMVWRITGSVNTALFFNAIDAGKNMARYVALAGHVSAIIGAAYALCVLLLLDLFVPIVFGARFVVSQEALMILALAAFVRIVRGEPFGSMLLLQRRTKRLALINIAVAAGLLVAAVLMFYYPRIESALTSRLLGEVFGLCSAIYLTRKTLHDCFTKFSFSLVIGFTLVMSGCMVIYLTKAGTEPAESAVALLIYASTIVTWSWIVMGSALRGRLSKWLLRMS